MGVAWPKGGAGALLKLLKHTLSENGIQNASSQYVGKAPEVCCAVPAENLESCGGPQRPRGTRDCQTTGDKA